MLLIVDLYEINSTRSNLVILLQHIITFQGLLKSLSFGCQLAINRNSLELSTTMWNPNTFLIHSITAVLTVIRSLEPTKHLSVTRTLTTSISPKFKNCLGTIHSPEDFEQYIIRNNGQGRIGCQLCQHTVLNFTDMRNHVESIHFPNTFSYKCPFCDQAFGTNKAFKVHKQRSHK